MIGRFVAALALFIMATPLVLAQAPRVLLRPNEVLSGQFAQQLQRAGAATVVDSNGSFTIELDQGLIWRLQRPVAATIAITPAAFVQWVNGKEVQHIPTSKAPMLGDIYQLLAASLSGDRSGLARDFAIDERDQGADWILVLKPQASDQIMASQLNSVRITGDRFIRTVVIQRVNGDVQTTRFSDLSLSTDPMTGEDQKLIAAARQ